MIDLVVHGGMKVVRIAEQIYTISATHDLESQPLNKIHSLNEPPKITFTSLSINLYLSI